MPAPVRAQRRQPADRPGRQAACAIDKGLAGPGLLAYVVTSKFSDYLPLYRLENIFERSGLTIDRSTMSVWAGTWPTCSSRSTT